MFAPEHLFGDLASPGLLGGGALLERAHVEASRGRRVASDLALGGYVVARLIDALLEGEGDGPARPRGALRRQIEMATNYVSTLSPCASEAKHLSEILQTVPWNAGSRADTAFKLTNYAYFLEYHGRLAEALQILTLSARTHGPDLMPLDFADYALFAARLNRLLARWDAALTCYRAAELAGRRIGSAAAILRGQLGPAAIARARGDLGAARAVAERIGEEAASLNVMRPRQMAYADLAVVYSQQGQFYEALHANRAAVATATSVTERWRALGDLGIRFREIGAYDAARKTLRFVACGATDFLARTNAVIELMNVASAVGQRTTFDRLRAIAAARRDRMSPGVTVDYLVKVGAGLARFGERDLAEQSLTSALQVAETHALQHWCHRIRYSQAAGCTVSE